MIKKLTLCLALFLVLGGEISAKGAGNGSGRVEIPAAAASQAVQTTPAAPSGPRQSRFDLFDKDHDGRLSRADFEAAHPRLASQFEAIDADGDGFVTKDEMQVFRASLRARSGKRPAVFEKADADRDGKLSRREFTAAYPGIAHDFAEVDANRDGFVTRREMRAYRRRSVERRLDQRFDAADADQDGRLSLQEFLTAFPGLEDWFAAVDADRDGFVTRQEIRNARMERAEKRE